MAVRRVHDEEMGLLLRHADDDGRVVETGPDMPRRMRRRREHLAAAPLALPQVILHDREPAGDAALVAKPLDTRSAVRRRLR